MLFTRTLRRKLMFGVGLVLVMLLILSASGIRGLNSYRQVVHDLDYALNDAPQKSDLQSAMARLFGPFRTEPGARPAAPRTEQFAEPLAGARNQLDAFQRRLNALPLAFDSDAGSQRPVADSILRQVDIELNTLQHAIEGLNDASAEGHVQGVETIHAQIGSLVDWVERLPDPAAALSQTLEQARNVYRTSLVAVWIASGVVFFLFLGLLRSGYIWIFHPIRQLHQGALRVAHGDFGYRVHLKSKDEMAELAAAFNEMTARFQEIRTDLDRQVQERSRQLVRSERLAGVGFLAAGVAHEINNPLAAIAMAAESLESRLGDSLTLANTTDADIVRQYLRMIQDESFRCKQITERLLDFSRGRDAVRQQVDLASLVAEVVAMVQYLGKYRDRKIVFGQNEACVVEANGAELKQVVLNLVANGLEAMSPGGTLSIALSEQTDHVLLEFRDDGCGMTHEVMENIFEPFFTRRQNGQGTGLGLSISHRIVAEHGGTLSASSAGPGQGSTFAVRLPRGTANRQAA